MRVALGVLLLFASPGCFEPEKPACAFLCGGGTACPEGYACGPDGRCHLVMSGGALAECQDTLPGADASVDGAPPPDGMADGPENPDGPAADGMVDARPIDGMPDARPIDGMPDAPPPDAMVDASPPDAMVDAPPNMAPSMSLAPTTTTYNLKPGDSITITVTGNDPDSDPLTYTAANPGTNRDPFAVGPAGAGDTAGGLWNPGTHVFNFEAGLLGTFDVRFTVDDMRGGTASQTVQIVVTAHAVMLNEVQLGPDNIELINTGGTAVNIGGWNVCSPFNYYEIPTGTTIAAGGFVVVHWNQTGSNTATEFYTGVMPTLSSGAAQVVLFSDNMFTLSRHIRDFVKWMSIMTGREGQAVFAGQWPTAASTTTTPPGSQSIARTPGANTEAPADWYVEDTPSMGAANVP